jgi:hypothetical protein
MEPSNDGNPDQAGVSGPSIEAPMVFATQSIGFLNAACLAQGFGAVDV